MMLSDPGGMEANFFGIDRLIENVRNELVGASTIVVVVVVAEREITEIHGLCYPGKRADFCHAGRRRVSSAQFTGSESGLRSKFLHRKNEQPIGRAMSSVLSCARIWNDP